MTTSFVHRNHKGFWCPDWLLEVFCYYLGKHLHDGPLRTFGEELVAKSTAGLMGCLDLGFDRLTPDQASLVANAVSEISRYAQDGGRNLNFLSINEFIKTTLHSEDIQHVHWIRICDTDSMVLGDRWGATAADSAALPEHWLLY